MEQREIKGSKSSYYKKSENKTIETTSKYINLGVKTAFDIGETAFILNETEYTNLNELANTDATKEIAKLNETISDLNNQIATLTAENETLSKTNTKLNATVGANESEILKLNNIINSINKELAKFNGVDVEELQQKSKELELFNKELNTENKTKTDYIVYLEQVQTDFTKLIEYYKNKNFLTPLLNAVGLSDIAKPQLKHLDLKGHQLNNANAPAIETNSKPNVKSE